jgi:cell division protein CrgA
MSTKANTGPGGAQRKGRSAEGRAAKGAPQKSGAKSGKRGPPRPSSKVGRYKTAEESGRYTPPVPRSVRRSPRWFGALVLILLIGGVLMILLNYIPVLPGAVTIWYLIGGLAMIFAGFLMATRYH